MDDEKKLHTSVGYNEKLKGLFRPPDKTVIMTNNEVHNISAT